MASNTSLAEATIVAGVNVIVVRVLTTRAQASCNGVDFTFRIVELTINGVKQIVTSQPNVVIPVIGGSVTINEQKLHTPTSGTINALHVDLGSTLDVKIGTATATVVCN